MDRCIWSFWSNKPQKSGSPRHDWVKKWINFFWLPPNFKSAGTDGRTDGWERKVCNVNWQLFKSKIPECDKWRLKVWKLASHKCQKRTYWHALRYLSSQNKHWEMARALKDFPLNYTALFCNFSRRNGKRFRLHNRSSADQTKQWLKIVNISLFFQVFQDFLLNLMQWSTATLWGLA